MSSHRHALITGTLYALVAGLMWGLVFVVPTMLAAYPAVLLTMGRYLAFGLIALPLAWWDRRRLAELTRADWVEAAKLAVVGNVLYYLCLAAAIQRAGGPLPTMIIGTLPVVIAVSANLRSSAPGQKQEGRLPWLRMWPSLLLIAAGLACVNHAETTQLPADTDLTRYALGALLAVAMVFFVLQFLFPSWRAKRQIERASAGLKAQRAQGGVLDLLDDAGLGDVRIGKNLVEREDRPRRQAQLHQLQRPLHLAASGELLVQARLDLFAVAGARCCP